MMENGASGYVTWMGKSSDEAKLDTDNIPLNDDGNPLGDYQKYVLLGITD